MRHHVNSKVIVARIETTLSIYTMISYGHYENYCGSDGREYMSHGRARIDNSLAAIQAAGPFSEREIHLLREDVRILDELGVAYTTSAAEEDFAGNH